MNAAWMEIGPPSAPDANAPVAVRVRAVPPRRCRELFSYEIESGSENDGGGWCAGRSDGDGRGLDMPQPAERKDPAGFDRRREDDRPIGGRNRDVGRQTRGTRGDLRGPRH